MFTKNSTKPGVEVLEICVPKVIISSTALRKMSVYVNECSDEIGWLGTVTKDKGYYYISDVLLFDQEVHATTTEITPEGLSAFGEGLFNQENGIEIWNSIKVWGHSHVNMGVSASGQDDKQMETFADNGHDYFIRIIANKKGDMKLDLYDYVTGVIYTNLDWFVNPTAEELEFTKQIQKYQDEISKLEDKLKEMEKEVIEELEKSISIEMKEKVVKKSSITDVYRIQGTSSQQSIEDWYEFKNKYKKKEEEEKVDYEVELLSMGDGFEMELQFCRTPQEVEEVFALYGCDTMYSKKEMVDMWEYSIGGQGYTILY